MSAVVLKDLAAERLRAVLAYDPKTGVFTWRQQRGRMRAGTVAGSPTSKGYLEISVDGERHAAHRLAWLYVHGVWPSHHIDHRNGVKTDNWIENLRDATQGVNNQNRHGPSAANTSGFLGVSWSKQHGAWIAKLSVGGKNKFLGRFALPEAASAAYVAAKRAMHEGCTL